MADSDDIQWIEPELPETIASSSGVQQQQNNSNVSSNNTNNRKRKVPRKIIDDDDNDNDYKDHASKSITHHHNHLTKRRRQHCEQRINEIRKRKREQFLKMLFITRTTLTPWTDIQEFQEVRNNIFNSIRFVEKDFSESGNYKKRVMLNFDNHHHDTNINHVMENLCFARDKLSVWKFRCRNIVRSQIIMSHLISLESILNVLIEQHNMNQDKQHISISMSSFSNSVIYSLYCEF